MTDGVDPLIGTQLAGRYRIERRLGMGGMGAVYLAVQDPLGRQVALKVLKPALISDPIAIERFKNEARTIASVGHPHIVAVHDFGQTDDGTLYLVMEYLQGRTLADAVKADGPMPWARTLGIVRDVARALAAAHKRGIVHRDLKPDNIVLVDVEGVNNDYVKVLDFGIAKLVKADAGAPNLTGTGFVPGTPGYIAPEQILGNKDDARCDLYALGVTWFEMLTGKRPFNADSAMKIFLAHLNDPAPKVGDVFPLAHLPPPVEALLQELMEKDPARRPADADALLARIRLLAEQGFLPEQSTATPHHGSHVTTDLLPSDATMSALATPKPTAGVRIATAASMLPATPGPVPSFDTSATRTGIRSWPLPKKVGISATLILAVVVVVLGVFFGFTFQIVGVEWTAIPVKAGFFDVSVRRALFPAMDAYMQGDLRQVEATVEPYAKQGEPFALFMQGLVEMHQDHWNARSLAFSAGAAEASRLFFPSPLKDIIVFAGEVQRTPPEGVMPLLRACDGCLSMPFSSLTAAAIVAHHAFDAGLESTKILDDPDNVVMPSPMAGILRARGLLQAAKLREAKAAVDAALEKTPSPWLELVDAEVLLALDDCDGAQSRLRGAMPRVQGPEASLLLARLYLLCSGRPGHEGDEQRRATRIATDLSAATPDVALEIAWDHGAALAGAGRAKEAVALFIEGIDRAVQDADRRPAEAPVLISSAGQLAMWGLQAVDAVRADAEIPLLVERTKALLTDRRMPERSKGLLTSVLTIVEGLLAVRAGQLDDAKARLATLEQLSERIPPMARSKVLDYVGFPIALLERRFDEALQIAQRLDPHCRRLHATAQVHVAARDGQERASLQALIAVAPYCRLSGFEGAYVLSAEQMLNSLPP